MLDDGELLWEDVPEEKKGGKILIKIDSILNILQPQKYKPINAVK